MLHINFNFLASHPDFLTDLSKTWGAEIMRGSFMFTFAQKLKLAKLFCRRLNRAEFSDIRERARVALETLLRLQEQLLSNPSASLFEEETKARENWSFFSTAEESFLKQKSRVKWLNEGDSNSQFFHRVMKSNQNGNAIMYLRDGDGGKVIDVDLIKMMAINPFKGIMGTSHFSVTPISVHQVQQIHQFRCTEEISDQLVKVPSPDEIMKTVFGMPKNKAPGPDGFPVDFFMIAWRIVGDDTIKAVIEFFHSGSLLKQFNATSICLIPKKLGADVITDFRPISCCNTIYKIISRILAIKIQLFLPQAVQLNQVGFVKGRQLCENVLLPSELVSDFQRVGPIMRGCLKVDISKAYDSINWDFIINILRGFGLPAKFIGWITECITTPSFSVALNGQLAGYFPGKKGLRQGDPISSYLFVLAMDILSKKLDGMMSSPRFKPHPLCSDPLITHLSFADDLLIFFDGSESSLSVIMDVFEEFAMLSGLHINLDKTTIILDGNKPHITRELAVKFNLQHGSLPLKYLGVPLTSQKLKPLDYQPLIDRVIGRVSSWSVRNLSFAGRLQLLRAVIGSMVNFWSSIFMLPQACLDKIEKVCNAYLWSGTSSSAKRSKIAWDSVCKPKSCGGLGLRRLRKWNTVFGLKLIWLLFSGSGSLWVSWIDKHLICNRNFWTLNFDRKGSWIWRKICKLRPIARPFLRCNVGNGARALFWHDNWCDVGPLIDLVGHDAVRITGLHANCVVKDVIHDGRWCLPGGRNAIVALLREALPPPIILSDEVDSFSWVLPSSILVTSDASTVNSFSSSKTWIELNPVTNVVPWHNCIWFAGHIPKHAFISWVAAWDRLPTRDRMHVWGQFTPTSCPLCSLDLESTHHLFFLCSYSAEIWSHFMNRSRLQPPSSFSDILTWAGSSSILRKLRVIVKLLIQAVIYEVWKERNARVHNLQSRPHSRLVKEISQTLSNRISFLSRSKIQNAKSFSSSFTQSMFSTWIQTFLTNRPSRR